MAGAKALLLSLCLIPAGLCAQEIPKLPEPDCENWQRDIPPSPEAHCSVAEPASGAPQCAGWGADFRQQLKETFAKLKKALFERHRKKSDIELVITGSKCLRSAASAFPAKVGGNPFDHPVVAVCDAVFEIAKNKHQLAAVLGHEIMHLEQGHGAEVVKLENKAIDLWKKSRPADYWGKTTPAERKLELESAVCDTVNKFGALMEKQANLLGVKLAKDAGFDPKEGAKWFVGLQDLRYGYLGDAASDQSHPDSEHAKEFEEFAATLSAGERP